MKRIISVFVLSLFLAFSISAANAALISINPTGDLLVTPGEQITFSVDFTGDDGGNAFGAAYRFDLGFDTAELALVSYEGWSDAPGVWGTFGGPYTDIAGEINDFNGYTYDDPLPTIEFTTLATVTFEALSGLQADGLADVWFIQRDGLTDICFDDVCHRVADITGHEGADVSAVPIPGAIWLLGSGLLGLIGIRRRSG